MTHGHTAPTLSSVRTVPHRSGHEGRGRNPDGSGRGVGGRGNTFLGDAHGTSFSSSSCSSVGLTVPRPVWRRKQTRWDLRLPPNQRVPSGVTTGRPPSPSGAPAVPDPSGPDRHQGTLSNRVSPLSLRVRTLLPPSVEPPLTQEDPGQCLFGVMDDSRSLSPSVTRES